MLYAVQTRGIWPLQFLRFAEFMSRCKLFGSVDLESVGTIVVLRLSFGLVIAIILSCLIFGSVVASSPSIIVEEGVSLVETATWKFAMSMWDLASDDGRTTAHKNAETPDDIATREPQAYSTMIAADGKESGYGQERTER